MTAMVVQSSSMPLDIPKILEVQEPKSFHSEKIWIPAKLRAMAHPTDNSEVARRLAILRYVVAGGNQTAFAKRLDIEVKRWNNFERGLPLSKPIAFDLVKKIPGLTLDWLFLGEEAGLSVKLQRELADAGKVITAESDGLTTTKG